MKFKDNIFYKAYEVKEKSNNFECKRVEEDGFKCKEYFYDFDIGVSMILARLLELNLNDNRDYVKIEVDFKGDDDLDYETRNKAYSPNEAFELLKDMEVKDLKKISFIRDYTTTYYSDSFYLEPDNDEVSCFSSEYDEDDY